MAELNSGQGICPNCHKFTTMMYTPGGIQYCPHCNYAPALGRVMHGTKAVDQPTIDPSTIPHPPRT